MPDFKENRGVRKTLGDVLQKVKNALIVNPDFCPEGLIPAGDEISDTGEPGYVTARKSKNNLAKEEQLKESCEPVPKKKSKKSPAVRRLSPTAVVKRMSLGRQGISCCIDHFGPNGPECVTQGTIIYINRDHPLYQKEAHRKDTYLLHLARLITQEVCLMKDPRNPRQAFERQSKLLKDALIEQPLP